jgi:hypothetical protein
MKKCPKCERKVEEATIKCECGHLFPSGLKDKAKLEVEPHEDRRKKHDAASSSARRYAFLRRTAVIYRYFAVLVAVAGAFRLAALLGWIGATAGDTTSGSGRAVAAAIDTWAIIATVIGTVIGYVTCVAVAQAIELLFEVNDRIASWGPDD